MLIGIYKMFQQIGKVFNDLTEVRATAEKTQRQRTNTLSARIRRLSSVS